jgi:hypothetical protein
MLNDGTQIPISRGKKQLVKEALRCNKLEYKPVYQKINLNKQAFGLFYPFKVHFAFNSCKHILTQFKCVTIIRIFTVLYHLISLTLSKDKIRVSLSST